MLRLKKDFIGVCLLAAASLCAGISLNQLRRAPLTWGYAPKEQRLDRVVRKIIVLPPTSHEEHWTLLSFKGFQNFVQASHGLVLDARPSILYRSGHVPGALSLPRDDFEGAYAKLRTQLESDKRQPLAVYCSGESCEDSRMVAEALCKLQFSNVFVFRGGWEQWVKEEMPKAIQ